MAITENDKLKQLDVLKTSYDMYEETKKTTIKNMKSALNQDGTKKYTKAEIDEELDLINEAQNELYAKYQLFGGDPEDLKKRGSKKKQSTKSVVEDESNDTQNILDLATKELEKRDEQRNLDTETILEKEYLPSKQDYNPQAAFDVIPLPSKGECYKNKLGKLPVAYLTAYDENMIISPNLYSDNKILDYILKEKVLNNTIDTGDLIEGDRDAIILFLRASGYGNEYPINATDKETGIEFESVVDLSKLKFKEFKLKGDENGWFDFTLPVSKKEIKFKFLSHNDLKTLEKANEIEESRLRKGRLKDFVTDMDAYIENEESLEKTDKVKVRQAIREIEKWEETLDEENALEYTHSVTNRLILQIMSIDGNTDKRYIRDFVKNMSVKDARALRVYMVENEPGIDYNIEIQRPESLGGGSMNVFLQLDQYVFLNVAE